MLTSERGYNFNDKTAEIIGACIEVHKKLGKGFNEIIYQRALANELGNRSLDFTREEWIPIFYRGKKIGKKRADFIIEGILVEIKAKSNFAPEDFIQAFSYLRSTYFEIGLLVNFGSPRIEIRRFVHTDKSKLSHNIGN